MDPVTKCQKGPRVKRKGQRVLGGQLRDNDSTPVVGEPDAAAVEAEDAHAERPVVVPAHVRDEKLAFAFEEEERGIPARSQQETVSNVLLPYPLNNSNHLIPVRILCHVTPGYSHRPFNYLI